MYAATEWIKFESGNQAIYNPRPGEWCLWSFVTEHGREYYSGSYYEREGKLMLNTEYGWAAELKDAYFARVNKLPANVGE
ncbi:MAG TPA: hypothetical protein VN256_13045 [Pyrinomonadaceae bacterium]|nr:hypothetical protein [Pyrinomonadaceae bacterium]